MATLQELIDLYPNQAILVDNTTITERINYVSGGTVYMDSTNTYSNTSSGWSYVQDTPVVNEQPFKPFFQVKKNGSQAITKNSAIIFDYQTPDITDTSEFTFDELNGEIILLKGGYYELNGYLSIYSSTNANRYITVEFIVNDVVVFDTVQFVTTNENRRGDVIIPSVNIYANAGEVFKMNVFGSGASTSLQSSGSLISIKRIGL